MSILLNDQRVDVSRPDGRPEAYDVPKGFIGGCALCAEAGKIVRYRYGELVMSSPIDAVDGDAHLICLGHLPEDIVIFNPDDGTCRSRNGRDVWTETEPGFSRPFVKERDA